MKPILLSILCITALFATACQTSNLNNTAGRPGVEIAPNSSRVSLEPRSSIKP